MNYRRSILSASIVAGLAVSLTALAQDAPPAEGAAALETIVVKGIRKSLKQSLDSKRNADEIVDVVTAEDIGKFPDKNVAETLSHLPGITVDRDFGQGERVSIRGTDPALNRTLLNGQTVASADWFILDSPGRTFNYTLLSPEVVGSLEVYKTPEARIDEGSVGGTVILHTRRPLSIESGSLAGTVEWGYNDRADEGNPNGSALFSWNNGESFGVNLSAIRSEDELRRDGIETFSYPSVGEGGFPSLTGADRSAVFPNAINAALFRQERTRTGGTLGLQFKPSDSFELNLTGLYVKAEYDNFNQSRYVFNGFSAPSATSATVRNGLITDASFGPGALTLLDAIVRESEVETYAIDARADWHGYSWDASATVGTTKADGGTQQQYFLEYESLGAYSYSIGRERAAVEFARDPTDPASMPGIGFGQSRQQPTSDEEQYVQGDFALNLDWGAVNRFQFGVKYRNHETGQEARLANILGSELAGFGLGNFNGGLTPGDFLGGIDVNGGLSNWVTVDRNGLVTFVRGVDLRNPFTGVTIPAGAPLPDFPQFAFDVEEDILAGYAQLEFGGDTFRGNLGVRYVDTDQTSRGTTVSGGQFIPNQVDKNYDEWLPSANLAFDLNDDLMLRFAASRVIARANFADLASFTSLTETVRSGFGGNPELDPYRANNFDLSLEWYLGEEGLFAATAFYKDIGTFIVQQSAPEQQFNILTGQVETFDIRRPRNGNGGEIKGIELSYQNSFGNGFGILANYTYADGSTREGLEIPFNSKNAINITPYYENERFSARLTYAWRDKYFREIGRNGVAVTNDDYTQLDAQIGFRITDNLEITAQGLNLLDETQYQYAGNEDRPLAIYKNGRRYFLGLRFQF
jgi:iron complex outermembrane receptor protein